MHRLVATIVLAVALAGCAAASPQDADPSDPPVAPLGAEASDDRGAIDGVVIDEEIAPVSNASVTLERLDASASEVATTLSDADGTFRFSLVEPGGYRLRATHPLFSEAAAVVDVAAGTVAHPRLTLTAQATDLPYVELNVFNGLAGCDTWGFVVTFATLGGTCPTQAQTKPGYEASFPEDWKHIVWEVTWDSGDESLGFLVSNSSLTCDEAACYGVKLGTPPIRLDGVPGETMQEESPFYNAPTGGIDPYPEGAFSTNVGAYYGGRFARETSTAVGPTGYCPGQCYGVATTLELRFAVYQSTFHFDAPQDLGAYSALPDQ